MISSLILATALSFTTLDSYQKDAPTQKATQKATATQKAHQKDAYHKPYRKGIFYRIKMRRYHRCNYCY